MLGEVRHLDRPSVLSFEVPEVFLAVSLPIVIELWWQGDMLMAIDMERKTFSTSTVDRGH